MNLREFEDYLVSLTEEQYEVLVQERIGRLSIEQQTIARAREVQKKYRAQMMTKACDPNATEDDQEALYNALREGTDHCEHGRSYCKHCIECGEMDHLMFPELYDEHGEQWDDDEN